MIADLPLLLQRVEPAMAAMTTRLAEAITTHAPALDARVRVGWGSVNFHHPTAGFVCALFPMHDHVSLVFEHGRQLSSPLLEGDGKQVRFIRFLPDTPIPEEALSMLLIEAIALKA